MADAIMLKKSGGVDENFAKLIDRSIEIADIPSGVTQIGDYAFYGCNDLSQVSIPSGVTKIGNYAFYDCRLLSQINIPNSVTSIGVSAFAYSQSVKTCQLQVSLPDSVETLGERAFQSNGSLTSIRLSNQIQHIGQLSFWYCANLSTVNLPTPLLTIGDGAFYLTKIETLEIPASVQTISSSFGSCRELREVTFLGTPQSIHQTAFGNTPKLLNIKVPWSQGEVAGAPWGATNAVITYDYTGD